VAKTLSDAGKTVDAHYYANEGNGFTKRENQIGAIDRTIDFFESLPERLKMIPPCKGYLRVRKRISQSANTKPVEFQSGLLGLRTDKQKIWFVNRHSGAAVIQLTAQEVSVVEESGVSVEKAARRSAR
jgi:hypothetical protein